jgi:hypothetical protein
MQQQPGASSNAIIALVLGILSFVGLGCLTGIPAWIVGRAEVKKIDEGQSPSSGRTLALVGMYLGIVSTVLTVVGIAVVMLFSGAIFATAISQAGAH